VYRIAKRFDFDAAHQLTGLPEGHKCRRLHGHTYVVEIEAQAETLDGQGMVADYATLDPFGAWLRDHIDHRNLNEVLNTDMPTTEHVAEVCYGAAAVRCPGLQISAVRVWESSTTWAEYRP
jgi:6-pyruvoyltetrahydropterin/6-carboxytetrahydropterin synthase